MVMMVYMGIYGLNNPDAPAWYGETADGKQHLYRDDAQGTTDNADPLFDIHALFVMWFLWVFIQCWAPCAAGVFIFIFNTISPTCGKVCGCMLNCAVGCSGLAVWVSGLIWRFGSKGQYSVGDIPEEGKSMEEWELYVRADGSIY